MRASRALLLLSLLASSSAASDVPFYLRSLDTQRDLSSINENFRSVVSDLTKLRADVDVPLDLSPYGVKSGTQTWSGANTFSGTSTFSNTITTGKVRSSCPTGFTEVHSTGHSLGCIETAEHGSAAQYDAQSVCFTTYGGRLPTGDEWVIAVDHFVLTDETDDFEWVGDVGGLADDRGLMVGNPTTHDVSDSANVTSQTYRCFIPK